jgi:hypothetical protein
LKADNLSQSIFQVCAQGRKIPQCEADDREITQMQLARCAANMDSDPDLFRMETDEAMSKLRLASLVIFALKRPHGFLAPAAAAVEIL